MIVKFIASLNAVKRQQRVIALERPLWAEQTGDLRCVVAYLWGIPHNIGIDPKKHTAANPTLKDKQALD
ncbi:hypothetical protein PA7559_34230 [Pseudoalteromonas distincta]